MTAELAPPAAPEPRGTPTHHIKPLVPGMPSEPVLPGANYRVKGAGMIELGLAIGFLISVLGVGVGAATSAPGSPLVPVIEACCFFAVGLVVILELHPAAIALRDRMAAIRRFRRELEALPETPHPLDQVGRPRSTRSD